jgi:release factor glutamine methyltransferase
VIQPRGDPVEGGEGGPSDRVVARLAAAGCVAPVAEATELRAAAPDAATLERWLRRREGGEPLAWITGSTEFCGRRLHVAPGVYVPRPQTEELARRASAHLRPGGWSIDLCTGCGAVAAHLAAELPSATVIGVDVDRTAAACARRNGVPALAADLDAPLRAAGGADVVTAVAPYVPTAELAHLPRDVIRHEPTGALDGGADGLDLVRRVVAAAARLLHPGGRLLLELGGEQDAELAPALAAAGFTTVETWYDQDGDLRGLAARRT